MSELVEYLAHIMVTILGLTHKVTQTYWIDIILLTLFVRLLISPINRFQTRTMKVMTELQPKLKELQEKYKSEPNELNARMMQLYREHKVNPMMGCLPLIIQMPVLISLFYVLRSPQFYKLLPGFEQSSMFGARLTARCFETAPFPEMESLPGMIDLANLFHHPFFFDRFLYLPAIPLFIFYIATTVLQTKQMQASNPQSQSNQMNFMLPLLLWFGLIFPVGLLLYFGLSNVFQMQQYASIKKVDIPSTTAETESKEQTETPPPPPPKKRKRKRRR